MTMPWSIEKFICPASNKWYKDIWNSWSLGVTTAMSATDAAIQKNNAFTKMCSVWY